MPDGVEGGGEDGSENPSSDAVSIRRTRIVGRRSRWLTVEWLLAGQTTPGWMKAFEDVWRTRRAGAVTGAYGGPIVMQDQTVVWAVSSADVRAAMGYVEFAVASANDHP